MGRGKIVLQKIENKNSRQVTFSKRRGGLMKKAKELAILCDAQIAVIVYSCTGKLYQFATSCVEQILERRNQIRGSLQLEADNQLEPTVVEINALKDEIQKLQLMNRRMMGKELDGLTLNELQILDHQLTQGYLSVKHKKNEVIEEQMEISKQKEMRIAQQNEAMLEKIEELRQQVSNKDHSHGSTSMHECNFANEGTSDTSLRLGLSWEPQESFECSKSEHI